MKKIRGKYGRFIDFDRKKCRSQKLQPVHASLLGWCHESAILGDDMLGQALRCVRGIEVNEDTISLEVMRATCIGGPGHYLGADQTLSLMQSEYVYPACGDRTSPKEWVEIGRPDLVGKAIKRKNEILAQPSRALFAPDVDAAIRARFPIRLGVL